MRNKRLTVGSLFDGIGAFSLAFQRAGWELAWTVEIDPECRRVTSQRFPGVRQYEDVRHVGRHNLDPVDLVLGGSPCFVAGTLILCRRGLVSIEEVIVGDEVLTHECRWRKVIDVMRREEAPTVRLRGQGHPCLVTTADHPIWSARRVRRYPPQSERRPGNYVRQEIAGPEWIEARHMKGRHWGTPTLFPEDGAPPISGASNEAAAPEMTLAFWWLVGAWLGNGWLHTGQRSRRPAGQINGRVTLCASHERVGELQERVMAAGLHGVLAKDRTADKIHICHRPLTRWLEANFGRYAHGKTIPTWLLGMPADVRRAVLGGYIWTDGSKGEPDFITVSKKLAIGMRLLAGSLGYSTSLGYHVPAETRVIEGRTVRQRPQWNLECRTKARSAFHLVNHLFGCVREVAETGRLETVYNLEVEQDNSYVADGITVHNCTGLSVAGKREGLADERSGLFLEMARIVDEIAPRWVCWENVPGAYTSAKGEDFACVLELFTGFRPAVPYEGWLNSGFCVGRKRAAAWCLLDTQFRGLAQRRERVFLVARAGDVPGLDLTAPGKVTGRLRTLPIQVLLEPESVCRDTPPGGKKRKGAARRAKAGAGSQGGAARPGEGQEGQGQGREEAAQAYQCHGGNVGPVGTLRAGNGGLTGGVPFLADPLGTDRVVGAISAKWAKGTSGPAGDECENLIPVEVVGPLLGGGRRGDSLGADEAGAGHIVTQPFNIVGMGQEGKNHAYPTQTSGCLQHKGLCPTGNEAGTVVVEPIGFYPTGGTHGVSAGEVPSPALKVGSGIGIPSVPAVCVTGELTHALTSVGADASEDGTGRGTPVVAFHALQDPISGDISSCRGTGSKQGCGSVGVATHDDTLTFIHPRILRNSHTSNQVGIKEGDVSDCLTGEGPGAVAFRHNMGGNDGGVYQDGTTPTVIGETQPAIAAGGMTVRRLTPVECLRLQGLPDDWMDVDPPLSDSAKYRACGNAGGVPILYWIANRIKAVEEGRDPNEEATP